MQQYYYQNNILNLKVKRSPFLVRIVMFVLAFSFFILPICGAIFSVAIGEGLHIGFFVGIGIFSLFGFYLIRVSLWNTYGEETIIFFENKIIYEANYGWFKDGKKETIISNPDFYVAPSGYEEDKEGVLVIASNDAKIESVVKMKIFQLEELISILHTSAQ
ncbi:hypothetical protein [Flavobacterium sp. YJ01]|uniref:hypothetical protein n=1 Tax=unclassified Flavobacterium TaxID=196869 RepID=UPI0023E43DB9|nr:hypothetical protein [Flavobacterium sp. YJ01]WET02148.1 hypothetical protein P0R33_20565 [Flavobacterium sp. YJ01]